MPQTKRISTHQVRRQEIEDLKRQIKLLQRRVDGLKSHAEICKMSPSDRLLQLRRLQRTNSSLQGFIQDQRLVIAGAQSECINLQNVGAMNPLHTHIHLPRDQEMRKLALECQKERKLYQAFQYVTARSKRINLRTRHSSERRFQAEDGSFSCERFEVIQLSSVKSLKGAYNAAKFFVSNVEISTLEALGSSSERKDYETIGDDHSACSFCLISANSSDITTESKKVMYTRYCEDDELGGGRPYAVIVADSVDQDDLHPYNVESRTLLDVSLAIVLSEVRRNGSITSTDSSASDSDKGHWDVVLQCAVFAEIHGTKSDESARKFHAFGDGVASWVAMMAQTAEFCDAYI